MPGIHRSSSKKFGNCLPSTELLDDLCRRFVLNLPEEDHQSLERILFLVFLVEYAYCYWYYEDIVVENDPTLKSLSLKEFTCHLFNSLDDLRPYVTHIDGMFKDFNFYKCRVPVAGAVILDQTYERCLLVKGWRGSNWSFPRGKKSKDEEDHACAIREVLEETGFDISNLLNKEDYIEFAYKQRSVRLYIVAGVKNDTVFAPRTKKEISEIAWHRLDHLQPASNEVAPFLWSLKSWILKHPVAQRPNKSFKALCVWNAKTSITTAESHNRKPELKTEKMENNNTKLQYKAGSPLINFKFNMSAILQNVQCGCSRRQYGVTVSPTISAYVMQADLLFSKEETHISAYGFPLLLPIVILGSFLAGSSFVTFLSGVVPHVMLGYTIVVAILAYFLLFSGFFITRDLNP